MRLDGRVLQVREVSPGEAVGYGAGQTLRRKSRLATIAVGYADGYMRALSQRGQVYAGDFALPVVGRVSMDLITVDATDAPENLLHSGSLVEIIGPHSGVDDMAHEAGTIGYEILTSLGQRYQRLYLNKEGDQTP